MSVYTAHSPQRGFVAGRNMLDNIIDIECNAINFSCYVGNTRYNCSLISALHSLPSLTYGYSLFWTIWHFQNGWLRISRRSMIIARLKFCFAAKWKFNKMLTGIKPLNTDRTIIKFEATNSPWAWRAVNGWNNSESFGFGSFIVCSHLPLPEMMWMYVSLYQYSHCPAIASQLSWRPRSPPNSWFIYLETQIKNQRHMLEKR